ncbi:hypothetical protein WHR41_03859 [Cladosporium halotolerans]|uniref:BTB domain-containing protein n=1 Tax=Cladosporium halotolerans TaxID=1052096 RepID=A0AB34KRA2_9PEZI
MAFPLGVPAHSPRLNTQFSRLSFRSSGETQNPKKPEAAADRKSPKKPRLTKKVKPFAARKRANDEPLLTTQTPPHEADEAVSPSAVPSPCSPSEIFELPPTSPRGKSTSRPKHIPIVIPDYRSFGRQSPGNETQNGPFSTFASSYPGSPQAALTDFGGYGVTVRDTSVDSVRERPRHVEIKIPDWAQPVIKRPNIPPRLSLAKSTFGDTFADVGSLSPPDVSFPSPAISGTNTMDTHQSEPSPTGQYNSLSSKGSNAYLSSAHSSQSSLVGMRAEYESASEAESTHDESRRPSHTPGHSLSGPMPGMHHTPPTQTPASNSNLSGLVCNVHRTTGREPHPLVGATTTILGDKLYVFGGRRLSRAKPQLTSSLYELDLIRRHWTKLETKGDIPPPRYFHSVCALGDTKLVCYGGMSPAPGVDIAGDGQSEVVVMSDIHIYDAPTRTWMKVATTDAPQGRYAHCTAILPSSAVFSSSNAPLAAVHHNAPGSNPNSGTLGVSIDGTGGAEMIVVGGQDSANHYIEQISIFNLRSLKWTGTTGMGRSCGAYRSVVAPLTTMTAEQIGAGPHGDDADDDETDAAPIGSGAPMLIYSNYNFLDVKLELQVRLTDGTLTEKPMRTEISPPGLRFPNGGVIDNHFVVSGTFLTSSKQEYALWALDLRTLSWSRIDASGSIFSQGSWNRGVLWSRRNSFVILGNRKRSLVDDYNNRRINFSNICLVELESFGLYDNPRTVEPSSSYVSCSAPAPQIPNEMSLAGRHLPYAAEALGVQSMSLREMADMDFLAIDGTRIAVNSRLIARRWGPYFTHLLRESLVGMSTDTDTSTLRAGHSGHAQRHSNLTITPAAASGSNNANATNNSGDDVPDVRVVPPPSRPRLLYLPHTAPTLQAMLHYLYTGTLPSPPSSLATPQIYCSLLQLARPYKIDGLLEAVVQRLHESLDGRNAAAIFNAAAMGAGGGDGVQFESPNGRARESVIPLRTASLANADSLTANGFGRSSANLRIDTDMANGRNTRNTLRPGQSLAEETDEEDLPGSAATDTSMSESETSLSARSLTGRGDRGKEVWTGALSAVVGLQKRGLRGLMEGRRMRERGRSEGMGEGARVGLGIA